MDRRTSLKTLFIGGLGTSFFISSCIDEKTAPIEPGDILEPAPGYGRTQEEIERDQALMNEVYLTKEELNTLGILADIILPEDEDSVSATQAGVIEFLEFIVKDIPEHKLPLRGGLMWLNRKSLDLFEKKFDEIETTQQTKLVDIMAYPEKGDTNASGISFFQRLKNLVITGYFTSEPGLKYLDYRGNTPNVWDGVPQEVLDRHGLSYDEKILNEAMNPATRNEIMVWKREEA